MNGKAKLIGWLLGVLQALLFAGMLYWTGRIERIDGKAVEHGQQLARLEAHYAEILRRLDRIEASVERFNHVEEDSKGLGSRGPGRGADLRGGARGADGLRAVDTLGYGGDVGAGEHSP